MVEPAVAVEPSPRRFPVVPPSLAMASGTLVSRMTGLARTAGLAAVLGVGLVSDAYTAASVVPTMLLVLVTGGTLSAALVPLLSRAADDDERRRVAGTALGALGGVAAAASLLLAISAPAVARFLSLGARGQPDHADRVRIIAILLVTAAPQVLLLALTAVTSAVLTARGRLGVVGWAPVTTNVAFLLALVGYAVVAPSPTSAAIPLPALLVLGLGSTFATGVGCAVQLKAAAPALPSWRTVARTRDAAVVRELRRTGGWTLIYVIANQLGLLVVLAVAARGRGVASAYQWSFTVMQLPFALIGVTVLSATLPALARAADDIAAFERQVRRASFPLLACLVPSAAGMALFAPLAARLLAGYGAADNAGRALVARGVTLFAMALLPFSGFQLLTRSCYALGKPSWPALTNLAVNAVTVAGALLALRADTRDGVLEVLVSTYALSYVVGCVALATALRRTGVRPGRGLWRPGASSGLATVVATFAVVALREVLAAGWQRDISTVVVFAAVASVGVIPWLLPQRAATTAAGRSR